jgi:signal transduction histidine kinase
MVLQEEPVRLLPFLAELVTLFTPQAIERGNSLALSCLADPGVVCIDKVKLRQVLMNLLSNANKFTEEGEIELRLQIGEAGEKGGSILFQ